MKINVLVIIISIFIISCQPTKEKLIFEIPGQMYGFVELDKISVIHQSEEIYSFEAEKVFSAEGSGFDKPWREKASGRRTIHLGCEPGSYLESPVRLTYQVPHKLLRSQDNYIVRLKYSKHSMLLKNLEMKVLLQRIGGEEKLVWSGHAPLKTNDWNRFETFDVKIDTKNGL